MLDKPFYSDDEGEDGEEEEEEVEEEEDEVYEMDPDHRLMLQAASPLLQNRYV